MFEFEIDFAHRQANGAREQARFVRDELAQADWLTMARMWERLAVGYRDLHRTTRAPKAA